MTDIPIPHFSSTNIDRRSILKYDNYLRQISGQLYSLIVDINRVKLLIDRHIEENKDILLNSSRLMFNVNSFAFEDEDEKNYDSKAWEEITKFLHECNEFQTEKVIKLFNELRDLRKDSKLSYDIERIKQL